jgi:hypothetical protein
LGEIHDESQAPNNVESESKIIEESNMSGYLKTFKISKVLAGEVHVVNLFLPLLSLI